MNFWNVHNLPLEPQCSTKNDSWGLRRRGTDGLMVFVDNNNKWARSNTQLSSQFIEFIECLIQTKDIHWVTIWPAALNYLFMGGMELFTQRYPKLRCREKSKKIKDNAYAVSQDYQTHAIFTLFSHFKMFWIFLSDSCLFTTII